MAAMPYMVKTFKNLLQNRGCLRAESLHKSSGMGGLPKLLNDGRTLMFDLFKRGQVCFPIHLYRENVENNDFFSEVTWPILLKFHVDPLWGREMKDC